MSRILAVFRRDLDHLRGNAIALLVCVGIAVIPALYAWFNIAGSWDPYGNTGQLKVALANLDEGYEGELVRLRINVGDRVVRSLSESEKIDYVVTSEDDAVEGVRSGEYYAAVVVPQDFTKDLLSVLSANAVHPTLRYYVNEKRNAIASIVTGKASGSVQTLVEQGFSESVTEVAATLFDDMSALLDEDGITEVAGGLGGALDDASHALRRASEDLKAYEGVVASIGQVTDASSSMLGSSPRSLNVSGLLSKAASGVRSFNDAARSATDKVSDAVDAGLSRAEGLETAVDEAFDVADGQADRLDEVLTKVGDAAKERRDRLQELYNMIDALDGDVASLTSDVEIPGKYGKIDIDYVHTVQSDLSDLKARVGAALDHLNNIIDSYDRTVDDLRTSRTDAQNARAKLKGLAADARTDLESVSVAFDEDLAGSLDDLVDMINGASATGAKVSSSVKQMSDDLTPLLSGTTSDITKLQSTLGEAAKKLGDAADSLDDLENHLSSALASGDVDLVRTIIGSDPEGLAEFISAPVEVDRQPIYAIENNGSAMAPYYTTMALWVGGTLIGLIFYVGLSEEALRKTKAKPHHAYFGRLAFFVMLGACQSTILALGDLFFLGIQCQHPLLFVFTCWLGSFVFINIIYSLATSFGDVGKAIAVLFMVVQVAGSGGSFPVQMLPEVFRVLYPFMPFVYSENAMRSAMFGVYNNDWAFSMLTLAAYLIPALLLGLLLRKPFVPVNEWIEEKLEQTKLM